MLNLGIICFIHRLVAGLCRVYASSGEKKKKMTDNTDRASSLLCKVWCMIKTDHRWTVGWTVGGQFTNTMRLVCFADFETDVQ
jgi:hypothetical protein